MRSVYYTDRIYGPYVYGCQKCTRIYGPRPYLRVVRIGLNLDVIILVSASASKTLASASRDSVASALKFWPRPRIQCPLLSLTVYWVTLAMESGDYSVVKQ